MDEDVLDDVIVANEISVNSNEITEIGTNCSGDNEDSQMKQEVDNCIATTENSASAVERNVSEDSEQNVQEDKNAGQITAQEINEVNVAQDDACKEKEELLDYIRELQNRVDCKERVMYKNQNIVYSDETKHRKQDSSLKKNTAFVRKLKHFTEQQLENLLKEMSGLNLEKYISEVATALVEAKLKFSDVPAAIVLCTKLHEMYVDFSKVLFENWQKILLLKKDEKISNPSKIRVDLRFFCDLITNGILPQKDSLPVLRNILTVLTVNDKDEHNNSSIIMSFCKYCGEDYAGILPKRIRELSQKYKIEVVPKNNFINQDKQRTIKAILTDYYSSLCTRIIKERKELHLVEKQNKKILQTKGELSSDRKEKWESSNNSFQKLHTVTFGFSEMLDEPMPEFLEDKSQKDTFLFGENECDFGSIVWEDPEIQKFYEDLPNVREFVPNTKVSRDARDFTPDTTTITEEKLDEEIKKDDLEDDGKKENIIEELEECEDDSTSTSTSKVALETFLNHLPNCINTEMIDNAAIEFVMNHNNKSHRRKLVKTLFNVPRTRLDLLPFYSRLVAILHPVMADVANDLVTLLKYDFKYHVRKKDQINIEAKIKVVRFIGELVKFRMYSKLEGLYCLKILLHDFSHHHIEMTCHLVESAGRFFFNSPDTYPRTKVYLEQMIRKKLVMNLDWRYSTMIENAYYYVNPPEVVPHQIKEKSPLEQYICTLLYEELNNTDQAVSTVLDTLRRLDWEDENISRYAIKCLTNAWRVKYYNIRSLANLLAGLVEYQESVGTQVVDSVLEDIRIGLEANSPKMNQRRIAMIKYLGELYNYRMVESNDIFKVLYSLISFGVFFNNDIVSPLDPPENTFRIRLVCVMLETCGQYFVHGLSKTRLEYFFIYFQHYYWFKRSHPIWTVEHPFPVVITYNVRDTLLALRPNAKLHDSYEEAKQAMEELQQKLMQKLEPLKLKSKAEKEGQLTTILEGDAEEEDDEGISSECKTESHETESEDTDSENEDERGARVNFDDRDDDSAENDVILDELSDSDDGGGGTSEIYRNNKAEVTTVEDSEFIDAFDKMVSENIQERLCEQVKPQHIDISVPYNVRNTGKKNYEQLLQCETEVEKSIMNFTLIVRKGNKHQYKNLEVPINSELALNLRSQEKAQRDEKERVKRLTLDINDRLEEEDYQDQISSKHATGVASREKKKYQQQQVNKGVPDTETIFGKKKVPYK